MTHLERHLLCSLLFTRLKTCTRECKHPDVVSRIARHEVQNKNNQVECILSSYMPLIENRFIKKSQCRLVNINQQ